MKKKILISAYSLGLGGIEKALVNLLCMMDKDRYDITLVLEKKEGLFLEKVPEEIKIVEYKVCDDKNILLRKIKNRIHLLQWKKEHHNRYDFAISFTTYSRPGARIALNASSNNALWIHNNYEEIYNRNEEKMRQFFRTVKAWKFSHLVFVSNDNKEALCKYFKEFDIYRQKISSDRRGDSNFRWS